MYLISIYFDEKTNKSIEKYIQRVAEVTGNTFMLDNQVPPHITVAAAETKQEDIVLSHMDELAKLFCKTSNACCISSFESCFAIVQCGNQ